MRLRHMIILLLLVGLVDPALAEKVLKMKNSQGADVIETVYEEGDNEYRYEKKRSYFDDRGYKIKDESFILANDYNDLGVMKTIKSYFSMGQVKELEVVFREEKAMEAGYERIALFYDPTGTRKRMEVYFKDDHRDRKIYSQSTTYYDLSGVKTRTIYFFSKRLTETTGYHRIIERYNQEGRKISEKIIDQDGNVH